MEIEKSELQRAEDDFAADMRAMETVFTEANKGGGWDFPWDEATRDNYKDVHRLLQRMVDLANHAGSHALKIEYLRLGEVPDTLN